jgi:Ca2+-binding EF-hand superfamily protein
LEHEVDGGHNYGYDHEAFLGKDEAKTFDQLTPEESKQRLRAIVKKIDKDANGLFTEKELTDWVNYIRKKSLWDETARIWREDRQQEEGGKLTWMEYLETSYNKDETEEQLAQRPGYAAGLRRDRRKWKEADKDGDGELNIEEYAAFAHPEEFDHMKDIFVDEVMASMDSDKDGFVSKEEYLADLYRPQPGEKEPDWIESERTEFHRSRDINKDGKMDKKEVKEMLVPDIDVGKTEAAHLIYEADANKDGKLSEEEIIAKYDVFVGSRATDFGEALVRHEDL